VLNAEMKQMYAVHCDGRGKSTMVRIDSAPLSLECDWPEQKEWVKGTMRAQLICKKM